MDYRERLHNQQVALSVMLDSMQASLWTALPGVVSSVDLVRMTVEVQPTIQGRQVDQQGNFQFVTLPVLPDVPICFPCGGNYMLTFPVKPGDECLVVFASRAIDNWWQQGEVQTPHEPRMHDLSDGFAIIGPRSQPNVISNISATTTQLRNLNGQNYVEVDDAQNKLTLHAEQTTVEVNGASNTITLTAPTQVIMDTPRAVVTGQLVVTNSHGASDAGVITGELNVSGNVISGQTVIAAGDVTSAAVSLRHHVHSNSGGTGNSGPPVGG